MASPEVGRRSKHSAVMPDTRSGNIASLLERYLRSQEPESEKLRVTECNKMTAGVSHATYFLKVMGCNSTPREHEFVLRAAPDASVRPGLDLVQQYAIFKALEDTAIPVPRVRWFDSSGTVLGQPFFISEKTVGATDVTWNSIIRRQGPEAMHKLRAHFVKVLSDIHALNWHKLPFSFLPVPKSPREYALMELSRWRQKLGGTTESEHPLLRQAAVWLKRNAPNCDHPMVFVHGDYRLMNIISRDDEVKAVLDWEVATIGDPIADLGMPAMKVWGKGFYDRREFLNAYRSFSGTEAEVAELRYWEAMGYFKTIACTFRFIDAFRSGRSRDLRVALSSFLLTNYFRHLADLVAT